MTHPETATALLREEHQRILQVTDVLETLLQRVDAGEDPDHQSLAECVAFIRLFADACHHGKEEDLLFPQLEARGVPKHAGPIAVMLQEHEIGRGYAGQMNGALPAMRDGDEDAWRTFRTAGYGYVELIRNHILKEDNVLFNMADGLVTGPACVALCAHYGVVCAGHFDGKSKRELEELADGLLARYGSE
jgi:hemerythrin-like domain-containing protein